MSFDYKNLTFAQIVDDLTETLCDLVINAGQRKFEPLLEALDIEIKSELKPSAKLVEIMNELLKHDRNQLVPEALELMKQATNEILRINNA